MMRAGGTEAIRYGGAHLDRAGDRRHNAEWVSAMAAHPDARVLPVWRDKSLILGMDGAAPPPPGTRQPRAGSWVGDLTLLGADRETSWIFLGLDATGPVFAADVSHLDEAALAAGAGGGAFLDLRQAGPLVGAHDAALLAYARAITGWHRRARYCGTCGTATESRHGGHMRRCLDPRCATDTFPRTDPAVIMLVERPASDGLPARCLLAHHARLPVHAYSTLAGFVEPGETLEEAVAREVLEETGVPVSRVTYHGSQPWPFPLSLMIGFRATADSDAIIVDPNELDDARWFSASELAAFGEWGDDSGGFQLPRKDSIARALVAAWLAEHGR